jgi:hypothetical protein
MVPAVLYQNNQITIALIKKGYPTSGRSRHINIRFFFIKDRVEAGEITVEYKPTREIIADILTKLLQGELFREIRKALVNCDA